MDRRNQGGFKVFQSTLPYGSDFILRRAKAACGHFNPRSLTGATASARESLKRSEISIHAPLRERPEDIFKLGFVTIFQSTLPYGSDYGFNVVGAVTFISIHAPLRERPKLVPIVLLMTIFQSTLPYGSDDNLNSDVTS